MLRLLIALVLSAFAFTACAGGEANVASPTTAYQYQPAELEDYVQTEFEKVNPVWPVSDTVCVQEDVSHWRCNIITAPETVSYKITVAHDGRWVSSVY